MRPNGYMLKVEHPFDQVHLSIGGIILRITSSEPGLRFSLEGAKERFLIQDAPPQLNLSVARRDLVEEPVGQKVFDS